MKRFFVALSMCAMLLSVIPAFGEQKADLPSVVQGIVQNRDFFTRPWILQGFEDYFLYEVNRIDNERIGVVLICTLGFEVRAVYDVNTLDVLFLDTILPEKSRREAMRRESVSVADAVKLAKSIMESSQ